MNALIFRSPTLSDTDRCYHIESTAYEGDEAATREKIALRIAQYPEGFLILEREGQVIGFINSGCAHQVEMADDAFKELVGHDAHAPHVVILSLVLDPAFQGKGYASLLMQRFVADMKQRGKHTIHLMCKEKHIPLYRHLGYAYVQPSPSSHGGMAWHEMVMTLSS